MAVPRAKAPSAFLDRFRQGREEERYLVGEHGEPYRSYREARAMLVPWLRRALGAHDHRGCKAG